MDRCHMNLPGMLRVLLSAPCDSQNNTNVVVRTIVFVLRRWWGWRFCDEFCKKKINETKSRNYMFTRSSRNFVFIFLEFRKHVLSHGTTVINK